MVALTTVAVRAADLTNADAVLNYVLAKTAGYDSYSAAFAENMTMPEDTLQLTGTIAFLQLMKDSPKSSAAGN